jgi:hypothetical protein
MSQKNPHAVELGRLGGQRSTQAKVEAARVNGRKGGRPRTSKKDDLSKRMSAENVDLMRKHEKITTKK